MDKYTQKAVDDPEFRKRVLEDANKAIKEEFGEEPPYKVTYHVTTPKELVFCLPPENNELDDAALESASGGVLDLRKQIEELSAGSRIKVNLPGEPDALCAYMAAGDQKLQEVTKTVADQIKIPPLK